jgi:hypothetical protein
LQVSASVETLDSSEAVTAMALDEYVFMTHCISVEEPSQLPWFDMQLVGSLLQRICARSWALHTMSTTVHQNGSVSRVLHVYFSSNLWSFHVAQTEPGTVSWLWLRYLEVTRTRHYGVYQHNLDI